LTIVAIAMWLQNGSLCHGMGARPTSVRNPFTRPKLSANTTLKMRPTATGATTKGSSTAMRQKVLARMFRSSTAAMKIARMSCGTEESRKMLKVLRSAVQKCGCCRIQMYWSNPMNLPELRTRSQSMNEMTAV
jgi:hypothetical protein